MDYVLFDHWVGTLCATTYLSIHTHPPPCMCGHGFNICKRSNDKLVHKLQRAHADVYVCYPHMPQCQSPRSPSLHYWITPQLNIGFCVISDTHSSELGFNLVAKRQHFWKDIVLLLKDQNLVNCHMVNLVRASMEGCIPI